MSRKRAFWKIVEELELSVKDGLFIGGSRLPSERELAEKYEVSRPTVREAIIALEVKGIVEVRTGAGIFINQIKDDGPNELPISAFELTQARALIEGESAALAAMSINTSELIELHGLMAAMSKGGDDEKIDKRFHMTIARATKNAAIAKTVGYLWSIREQQPIIVNAYKSVCDTEHSHMLEEHQAIVDALVEKNPEAARKAMHNHFNRLINALFDMSEKTALDEVRRKSEENRGRYSLNHLHKANLSK